MQELESPEETQEYLTHVLHPESRDIMADTRGNPSPASDLDGGKSRVTMLERDYNVLEVQYDPANPGTPNYALSDLGKHLLSAFESYEAEIDGFQEVYESFNVRREAHWTGFIGTVEPPVDVKELGETPRASAYRIFDDAEDLELIETGGESSPRRTVEGLTQRGEAVQSFVSEVDEALAEHRAGEDVSEARQKLRDGGS